MQSIDEFLALNDKEKVSIAVVGDAMLDEYYNVKVTRISPEFPTQIMHSDDWIPAATVPGGAANVCLQMGNGFNVKSHLLSLIDDRAVGVFKQQPFNAGYCVTLKDKETHMPLKRRFYDGDYPLPRWDIEAPNYGYTLDKLNAFQMQLLGNLNLLLENHKIDIVVLSDYGKGVFSNHFAQMAIQLCTDYGVPTIVDPKDPPVERWKGCTYFKPNAFEACKMTGLPHGNWWQHQSHLVEHYDIHSVIITDGPNPPFVPIYDNTTIKLVRQPNKQSVIGAGDCFCAFLAMCLARGMYLEDAVEVSWNASSLYIERKHNKPIMPHEFAKWNNPLASKVISVDEMAKIIGYDSSTWVWTNGCFDVLHVGHLKTLEAAKQLGNKVIVGLNTDASIKRLKGENRPVNNYDIRAEHLAHCQYVDFIVPIEDDTPLRIIERLRPHKIVKGGDYKISEIAGADVVGHENVHIVPLVAGLSTTKIIERINS
jgi:D-beta-D-heptose 7-phosphate kinase/D-beta-D-heptose 1-phosphate adenosyltransferase